MGVRRRCLRNPASSQGKGSASHLESRTSSQGRSRQSLPAPIVSPPARLSPPSSPATSVTWKRRQWGGGETDDRGHPPFHGLPSLIRHYATSKFKISLRSGSSAPEPTSPCRIDGEIRGICKLGWENGYFYFFF